MIGQQWPSEMREFKDEKTGRSIVQLTSTGNNVHFYFTENSFIKGRNEIIFYSDRASKHDRAPHESPEYNLFKMNLDTGVMEQIGDDPVRGNTKTPDGELLAYTTGQKVRVMNTVTGEVKTVYEETGPFRIASAPSIAPNRKYVAFCRNEHIESQHSHHGANYAGFKERFYEIKDGRITLAYLDHDESFDILRDTHQLGHFQFSPDDSTIGTFCHEGPWNLVQQRIWYLDFISRRAAPCFRQGEEDSIGHEFWTQDGLIFFDNRGPGHDGTITSHRTQAVATEVAVNENTMVPFVGLMDKHGNLIRKLDMPFYCNHYHANPDNSLLVGDDVDDLVCIDISTEEPKLEVLCNHKTSWHTQTSHCHPTWDWDGSRILYASDYGGKVQIYLMDM